MGKVRELSDREKELLHALGSHPEVSLKTLLNYVTYTRVSSIVRKMNQLREQHILRGPIHPIDYGKLCKNPLHKLFCIVETTQTYETVISYVTLIKSVLWIYAVLSPHKKLLNVGILSSNDQEIVDILQLLKDNKIITDYIIYAYNHKIIVENPNLFGDVNPSLDGLANPCDVPDIAFGQCDTAWNECDISILPYVEAGYKGTKLIEILKAEKKLNRTWKYDQIKYSYKKMLQNELIKKTYVIYPFPFHQCAVFNLFLETDDAAITQRILYNFARGGRVYKEWFYFGNCVIIHCISHPLFLIHLMHNLDQIDVIKEKAVYQFRSIFRRFSFDIPLMFDYYDVDKQTLEYPYSVYKEKIKEKIEND